MNIDQKYMLRAIQLGKCGLALAAPNPSVGCVLVVENAVIGEGFTSPFGGPHAEVNAIKAVKDKSQLAKATLYVTLEPCSHFGKTPPCADLIIQCGIPKVVIGVPDPNPEVSGRGVQRLQDSGCKVVTGVLKNECRALHKRFLTFHEKKRPFITLKWAESQDGWIAPEKAAREKAPSPFWITNRYSRQLAHRLRCQEMAILVGTHTVLEDNPSLTVRDWSGPNPIRIALDRHGKIPPHYHIMDGSTRTMVLTEKTAQPAPQHTVFEALDFSREITAQISTLLYERNIQSVLIEGGGKTLQAFIDNDLWDEALIFKGSATLKKGIKAPLISGRTVNTQKILNDTLIHLSHD